MGTNVPGQSTELEENARFLVYWTRRGADGLLEGCQSIGGQAARSPGFDTEQLPHASHGQVRESYLPEVYPQAHSYVR